MIRIISALFAGVVALLPLSAAAAPASLADNAPDSYIVRRGDTLWAISGRFLKNPWQWPQVWKLNKDQIRNPHLIYPGQVVMLDRNGPTLTLGKQVGGRPLYERRYPQVYSSAAEQPIPSIPQQAIEPFLTQPLVVQDNEDESAAVIIATEDGRVYTGAGDTVFAKNVTPGVPLWHVYRKAKPIIDPATKDVLGYEAVELGSAHVVADGTPATLKLVTANQEIGRGDRLLPAPPAELITYAPHAPDKGLDGRIIKIHQGGNETGRHNVVLLNLGKRDGLEVGHVMALYRNRGEAVYREDGTGPKERYALPEQRYGLVFVFRVFDRLAYALVMDVDGTAKLGDGARTP